MSDRDLRLELFYARRGLVVNQVAVPRIATCSFAVIPDVYVVPAFHLSKVGS